MNNKNNKSFIKALIKEMLLKELYSEDSMEKTERITSNATTPLKMSPSEEGKSAIYRIPELKNVVDKALQCINLAVGLNTNIARLKTQMEHEQDATITNKIKDLETQSDNIIPLLIKPSLALRNFIVNLTGLLPTIMPQNVINEIITNLKNNTKNKVGQPVYMSDVSKNKYDEAINNINIETTNEAPPLQKTTQGFASEITSSESKNITGIIKDVERSLGWANNAIKNLDQDITKNLDYAKARIANSNIFVYLDMCDAQPYNNQIKQQAKSIKNTIYDATNIERGELEQWEQQAMNIGHGDPTLIMTKVMNDDPETRLTPQGKQFLAQHPEVSNQLIPFDKAVAMKRQRKQAKKPRTMQAAMPLTTMPAIPRAVGAAPTILNPLAENKKD